MIVGDLFKMCYEKEVSSHLFSLLQHFAMIKTEPTPISCRSLFYSTQISYGPGGQNDKRLLEDCVFN